MGNVIEKISYIQLQFSTLNLISFCRSEVAEILLKKNEEEVKKLKEKQNGSESGLEEMKQM